MSRLDYSIYDLVDVPIFVLIADDQDRPVYDFINKAGRDRLGKDLPDIVGKPAHEVFEGRAAHSVFRRQFKAWRARTTAEYEVALPLRDNKVWFKTTLVAEHDDDGTLSRMVGTSLDVSAERALVDQEAMTLAASREMEDLVCLAAHDLRSPVSNLKSLAHLMRHDFVDHGDGKLDLINMIDALADKSLNVISEMMAQVMAQDAPVVSGKIDLGAVCDDILVLLDPFRVHTVSHPRIALHADGTAIQIMLRNLIDNAFRFAGEQAAQVEVSVSQINTQRLLLRVRDHGPGFGGETDGGTGQVPLGFGLKGVRRLAQARGGAMTLGAPDNGSGAEVRIELPGQIVDQMSETTRAS